jgi:ribonuclease R
MYDQDLAHRIVKILDEKETTAFRIKELAQRLKIGKHKYKDLIDTLYKLVKEDRIQNRDRKYFSKNRDSKKTLANQNKFVSGRFDATSLARNRSFAFVITEDFDIFVSSEDTNNAYHNDLVQVELRYQRNGKVYGIITKVLQRARERIVGTIEKYQGRFILLPDNSLIHTNFLINQIDSADSGQKVVLKVKNWGNRSLSMLPAGDIEEVLGKAGEPEVEVISVIKQYDLPLVFPTPVLAETELIPETIDEASLKNRIDLCDIPTITIDPVSAKDYDDAVSLIKERDGFTLFVHIADVAHYISPKSKLFLEAINRGNSYYFPKKVLPMLPEKISNKICSLRPFEKKLTLTVKTKLNLQFEIIEQQVFESVITSSARISYEEVDAYFEGKPIDLEVELKTMLDNMQQLSSALQKIRLKRGYLQFEVPETEFIFSENGTICDLQRNFETESHQIIENFMLIANEYIAKMLCKEPTIYRIHEKPDEEKMKDLSIFLQKYDLKLILEDDHNAALQKVLQQMPEPYHRVFDRIILRSMKKAKYSKDNAGHFGLALKNYTHFTSPIRRICDLIVHHQIKAILANQKNPFSETDLVAYAQTASEKELIADESEREVDLKNKAVFCRKLLGQDFSGIVISIRPSALIVELDKYPITGVVEFSSLQDCNFVYNEAKAELRDRKSGRFFRLTDRVLVRVNNIDFDIFFQLLEKIDEAEKK